MHDEAISVLKALLAGCDPSTGEVLDVALVSVLKTDAVKDALTLAITSLNKRPRKSSRLPNRPVPAGHSLSTRHYFGDKPIDIARELKSEYPDHVVFVQNGYFWETYDGDAKTCSEIFGWKVADHGHGAEFTGVPANAFRFKEKLEALGMSYILVGQSEYPSSVPDVERQVVELYDATIGAN